MEGYCLHIDFDGCNIFGSFMCVHEIDQKVNKSADECGSEQNGWTLCTTVLIEIEIEGDVIEIGLLLKLYIKKPVSGFEPETSCLLGKCSTN